MPSPIARTLAALCLTLGALAPSWAGLPMYRVDVLDLPTPGMSTLHAVALNDRGEVLVMRPYWHRITYLVWTPKTGALREWHTPRVNATLTDLNSAGQVAGQIDEGAFIASRHDGVQLLGGLSEGRRTEVNRLNDGGLATGHSRIADGESHVFLWSPDAGMVDLHPEGAVKSIGVDINRQGQIAGHLKWPDGGRNAAVFSRGAPVQDLGCLKRVPAGYCFSEAFAINDRGQVVGGSGHYGHSRAFIWSATEGMRELVPAGGQHARAVGINNRGQVIGAHWLTEDDWAPFYWDAENGMHDLSSLIDPADPRRAELGFFAASMINSSGQIVGDGIVGDTVGLVALTPLP